MSIMHALTEIYVPHSRPALFVLMIAAGIAHILPLYFLAHWIADFIRRRSAADRPEHRFVRGAIHTTFALLCGLVVLAIVHLRTTSSANGSSRNFSICSGFVRSRSAE